MHSLPRAILIDLDDTLLASSTAGRRALDIVAEEIVSVIPALSAQLRYELAAADRWFWLDEDRRTYARMNQAQARARIVERTLTKLGITEPIDTEALGRRFVAERLRAIEPIAGAFQTVAELRCRGVKLALVTNGSADDQRDKINRHAVDCRFDAVLVEGEVGFGKPDERIFRLALERLGAVPTDSWMVGDDLLCDIAGAQGVGIHGIWVRDHAASSVAACNGTVRPDRTVGTITELLQ